MHRLVFSNADAKPHNVALDVSLSSIKHVMAWYGAYFSGDRYTVTMNGHNLPMDLNGEPLSAHLKEPSPDDHE